MHGGLAPAIGQLGQRPSQLLAQRSGRMVHGEVVRLKPGTLHQRKGQGVSQGQLKRRAGGRGQVKAARFFRHVDVEHHARRLAKRRVWLGRECNNGAFSLPQCGEQPYDFFAASAFGQAHHHVFRSHCTEVPV